MPAPNKHKHDIPDPKEMNEEDFRKIRDEIKQNVAGLISSL